MSDKRNTYYNKIDLTKTHNRTFHYPYDICKDRMHPLIRCWSNEKPNETKLTQLKHIVVHFTNLKKKTPIKRSKKWTRSEEQPDLIKDHITAKTSQRRQSTTAIKKEINNRDGGKQHYKKRKYYHLYARLH